MTGYQPDPPRTGRGEVACRRMPAGSKMRGRPAMGRITAIAACRPRRVAIVRHFSTPCSIRSLYRQPDIAGAPTIRRWRPMPFGAGPCCLPVRPVIPVDCVLAGPRMVRCRTDRTPRHRLSHLKLRKERASFVQGRPHKAFIGQARGRNGRDRQDVAKLKRVGRRRARPCGGNALPDKARGRCGIFSRHGRHAAARVCRVDLGGRRRETFHALYMAPDARARDDRRRFPAVVQPTR